MIIHTIRDYLLFMLFSFMINYIKFLSKAMFTYGAKKLLYELNSSDIISSENLTYLL